MLIGCTVSWGTPAGIGIASKIAFLALLRSAGSSERSNASCGDALSLGTGDGAKELRECGRDDGAELSREILYGTPGGPAIVTGDKGTRGLPAADAVCRSEAILIRSRSTCPHAGFSSNLSAKQITHLHHILFVPRGRLWRLNRESKTHPKAGCDAVITAYTSL